jgi:hypothetical protein
MLETLTAEYRPSLSRLEGNRRLDAALGTLSARLCAGQYRRGRIRPRAQGSTCPLELAGFAALGVILELFVEKEKLFAGGEYKFTTTICAG